LPALDPQSRVDPFPTVKGVVDARHVKAAFVEVIKVLGMGLMSSFDKGVELGGTRGKNEEADALGRTSLLELRLKLATPVHLDGFHREWHASGQAVQEGRGGLGGRSRVGLDHVPARNHIPGCEVLERHPRHGPHVQCVHLHQIARLGDTVVLGFAGRINPPSCPPVQARLPPRRFVQPSQGFQALQYPAHRRGRSLPPLSLQQDQQGLFPPTGVLFPQPVDGGYQVLTPQRSAHPLGPPATFFQPTQAIPSDPLLPPIQGRPRHSHNTSCLRSGEATLVHRLPSLDQPQAFLSLGTEFHGRMAGDAEERPGVSYNAHRDRPLRGVGAPQG